MPLLKKFPTSSAGSTTGPTPGSYGTWLNPNRIFATDGSSATSSYWLTSDGTKSLTSGVLQGSGFGYALPSVAVIDGIQVDIVGSGMTNVGTTFLRIGTASKTATKSAAIVTNGAAGGPTDLWGRTDWTAADINDPAFFASWEAMASHDPSSASASIDSIAVTVFYHLGGAVAPTDVPTREVYKVFNAAGQYLGNLPNPADPLKLGQDINSLGSQLTIKVPVNSDVSYMPTEIYTTEDGTANYTTEDASQNYTTEGAVPMISAAFQGIDTLIKNGNTVQIFIYNYFYPNGKCMFIGKMRRWEADFGGDGGGSDYVSINLYSTGYDMDNYITRGAPFSYTNDQQQTTYNSIYNINSQGDKGGGWDIWGQSFVVGAGVTNIGSLTLMMYGTATVTINMFDGPGGNLLGSVTMLADNYAGGGAGQIQFGFPSLIPVTPGQTLFYEVRPAPGNSINIYYQNSNIYSPGQAYQSQYSGGSGGGAWTPNGFDMWFITGSGTPSTSTTFTNVDPSTGMLAPIISDYSLRGGSQKWNVASIDPTGLTLTYRFNVQTVYEALQAALSLAPNGFYYYLDLGTQTVYFKNASTTADFLLQKGVHINNLKLVTTTENSKNTVLFTGGNTGSGVNLFKQYASNKSIAAFGPLLDRKTDSRVTIPATADAIGISEIAELSGEQQQTTVTLVHTKKLDLTLLTPGKVVGFRGFGTFVDSILVQIVHRDWTAEAVTLTLGILPARLSYEYENTTRQLIAAQTLANPTSPS